MTTPTTTPGIVAVAPQGPRPPITIEALLESNRQVLAELLPCTLPAERFLRVALTTIERNPELRKCSAASLYGGILQAAQLGLEVGLLNQAHLVPYWSSAKGCFEAQFQIGYLGLRDLAERYGDVVDGDAQIVYAKDSFEWGLGDTPFVMHRPSLDQDRGEPLYYYSWARPAMGALKIAVLSQRAAEEHRDKFVKKSKSGEFGPAWTATFGAMALKTVMRANYKLLARSPQLRTAIALDEMDEANVPQRLGASTEQEEMRAARAANDAAFASADRLGDELPGPTKATVSGRAIRARQKGGVVPPVRCDMAEAVRQADPMPVVEKPESPEPNPYAEPSYWADWCMDMEGRDMQRFRAMKDKFGVKFSKDLPVAKRAAFAAAMEAAGG